jgi:hypothetical protein
MVDEGLSGDFHQRLWPGRGQRPHALAEPGGHHHRRAGNFGVDAGAER